MSNLLAAQTDQVSISAAVLTAGAAVGLAVAMVCGFFRVRSVVGPPRLAPGDSAVTLCIILAMLVMLWAFPPILYANLRHHMAATPAHKSGAPPPNSQPQFSDAELVVLEAVSGATVFVGGVILTIFFHPGGLTKLGLTLPRIPRGLAAGLLGIIAIFPWMLCVNVATEWLWNHLHLQHENEHQTLRFLGSSSDQPLRVLAVVTAVVIAPLSEELLFRGYLQTMLLSLFDRTQRSATARWGAILLTSLAFCMVHPWWMRPPIFFLSLGLGYCYERTANLWASASFHALFNAASVVLFLWQTGHIM